MQITEYLKLQTQALHTRTEKEFAAQLFADSLSETEYGMLLGAFSAAYGALEAGIARHQPSREILQGRSKLHQLQQDLSNLPTALSAQTQPTIELQTSAEAMGALYVTEGATLGGQIIARHLLQHPWIDARRHLNFFRCYGDRHTDMWQTFCHHLTDYDRSHGQSRPSVLEGAEKAFHCIASSLSEVRHGR